MSFMVEKTRDEDWNFGCDALKNYRNVSHESPLQIRRAGIVLIR